MTTVSMNFKTDPDAKKEFDNVAKELGLSSSALLNVFVKRVAREKGVPFKLEVVTPTLDEESKKEMIRVLAVENGLLPDSDRTVTNVDDYFQELGL